jgi:hypothetical protein
LAERESALIKGVPQGRDPGRPHAVQFLDPGFENLGQPFQARVPGTGKGASGRGGELGEAGVILVGQLGPPDR